MQSPARTARPSPAAAAAAPSPSAMRPAEASCSQPARAPTCTLGAQKDIRARKLRGKIGDFAGPPRYRNDL
eukprot:9467485-Pyramimonas_sp.AAC.1